jgi:hypothetical protein
MKLKDTNQNCVILDFPERDLLFEALDKFEKDKNNEDGRNKLFESLITYIKSVEDYCKTELKDKTYTFEHVVPQLFELKIEKDQQWKQYLKVSLYALKQYLEYLRKYNLHRDRVHQYRTLILTLLSDVEWLFVNYEKTCKNTHKDLCTKCDATRQLSASDLIFSMNALFFIDDCDNLAFFDMRDVKPNFMFIVRQFMETIGNQLIGFESILDKHSRPIHKFTQVAWDYLNQSDVAKQCISLPFKVSTIYKISQWANSFVHARYLHVCYMQFYALDFINNLMKIPQGGVLCYDGRNHMNTCYGDFRITNYVSLKNDFENFVKSRNGDASVQWLPIDKVGAYIVKL